MRRKLVYLDTTGKKEQLLSSAESEWLEKAIQGDQDAFTWIVETYQRPVYNLCHRMLGNEQEAEDAAQEAFWRAYKNLRRYDAARPFATWLLSITAHYCIDQQRKRRFNPIDLDDLPEEIIPDYTPTPEWEVTRNEESSRIQKMLEKLGPQDRAAIVLRYWHEFSEEEIARALNLTVSAVKSRLFRARRELAQDWERQHPAAEVLIVERKRNESPAL